MVPRTNLESLSIRKRSPYRKVADSQCIRRLPEKNREKALRWYEDGLEERSHQFFQKFGLRDLAVAELLKFSPKRAYDVMSRFQQRMPKGSQYFHSGGVARLDDLSQVRLILDEFPALKKGGVASEMRYFVMRESYRMGVKRALGELIVSLFETPDSPKTSASPSRSSSHDATHHFKPNEALGERFCGQ